MSAIFHKLLTNRLLALPKTIEYNAVQHMGTRRKGGRNKDFVKKPPPLPNPKYEPLEQSLKQKGYLRAQNPYAPPKDAFKMVLQLKSTANCSTGDYDNEFNLADKFKFLSLCATEFKHSVPSSLLHEMTTYDDVIAFYETPVNTILPLDEMCKRPLPPNLHIEHNYTRFDPSPNSIFKGHTAFPHRSTVTLGIKKKSKNFVYEPRWSRT